MALKSEEILTYITVYFSRLVLVVKPVFAGVPLPTMYSLQEWKCLYLLLGLFTVDNANILELTQFRHGSPSSTEEASIPHITQSISSVLSTSKKSMNLETLTSETTLFCVSTTIIWHHQQGNPPHQPAKAALKLGRSKVMRKDDSGLQGPTNRPSSVINFVGMSSIQQILLQRESAAQNVVL